MSVILMICIAICILKHTDIRSLSSAGDINLFSMIMYTDISSDTEKGHEKLRLHPTIH
jgi:hypothetical protein